MSRKSRRNVHDASVLFVSETQVDNQTDNDSPSSFWSRLGGGERIAMIAVCLLLTIGAMGAGIKYIEENSQKQKSANKASVTTNNKENQSFLSSMNPFAPAPTVTPTPQLSKEYLYAGSRILAVEDAGASAVPPGDLAVWRPSTGYWYVLGGQGSQQVAVQWGGTINGQVDTPVPGDYDGDGKTDFSVYRSSTGTWYIQRSSDSSTLSYSFGATNDIVAPADYDGDGKTDAAVYRPSTGYWYIQRSSDNGMTSQQFGLASDIPAPADYDGDGKADITVWRGSALAFYTLRSSDNTLQSQVMGSASSDKPVSADYDGDGKADYALLSGNSWIIHQSSTGQTVTTTPSWQQSGDVPVQNDYDGDGKVDIAAWRPSTGYWYIINSHDSSLRSVQWGGTINGQADIPVPAYYRR